MAAAIGLTIMVTGSWLACSPGEPNCDKVDCGGGSGSGGGGGGGTGGTTKMIDPPPDECTPLGVMSTGTKALDEFEMQFIVKRCGTVMCHGPSSVFPPRDLDKPAKIRPTINAGQKGSLNCKADFYVNKGDYTKSLILAKLSGDDPKVITCPSGEPGGTRMPNKDLMPTVPGDALMPGEMTCFTWYIKSLATIQ